VRPLSPSPRRGEGGTLLSLSKGRSGGRVKGVRVLELIDRLAARKLARVVVTKHGRPVAVLSPPPLPRETAEGLFGFMRASVAAPAGFDFAQPVPDEPLHAHERRLHEE
jgi:antitoxin (DNA-binding transcriptional repressor) of toxin-antitoxin stability system